jgi:23S rRNA (guanine745-N1)-methyltransferase
VIDQVLEFLRCPQCPSDRSGALSRAGGVLRCDCGHSFDIARAGYVSLLPAGGSAVSGDTSAMVAARRGFLAGGYYAGLAEAVASASVPVPVSPRCVVDVGAGTGYYLAGVLDRVPSAVGLALDLSRNALRVAARAHPRMAAIGADAWRLLPLRDGVADLVLNIFAPRNGAELRRIVRPDGRLVVVTPAADHLGELIGPLELLSVDSLKEERLASKLGPYFDLTGSHEYRTVLTLSRDAVVGMVTMGPSSWHAQPDELRERVYSLGEPGPVAVTVAVTVAARISLYRPR